MHSGNVGTLYEQHGFAAFGRVTGWRGLLNGVAVKPAFYADFMGLKNNSNIYLESVTSSRF